MIERYELVSSRIEDIAADAQVQDNMREYFSHVAEFMMTIMDLVKLKSEGGYATSSLASKKNLNRRLYEELLDNYDSSYLNPEYAVLKLGNYGQILSAVYAECRSMIAYAFEEDYELLTRHMELFVEVYSEFAIAYADGDEVHPDSIKKIYADYAYDYLSDDMDQAVRVLYQPGGSLIYSILSGADLNNTDYLYDYGEYISDNEIKMSQYLARLDADKIDRMAKTYVEGYRLGFVMAGKDLAIKDTVEIRFFIGFERVVRRAIELFDELGLAVTVRRAQVSFVRGRRFDKIGCFSTMASRQFECDHENDKALYFDKRYMERKIEAYHNALEKYKQDASVWGGPAVIECFGESAFSPDTKAAVIKPDEKTQKLLTELAVRSTNLVNEYVKGEERSFTIIAFPIPAIGDKFEEIFDAVIDINTLDYKLYQSMQQVLIDTLDTCTDVCIEGKNGNHTNLNIRLWKLNNPEKETIFENCVADVNIPVGEVFTSPVLTGTNGILHVKNVYLNGRPYDNLRIEIKDGMVASYDCDNYDSDEKNRQYIKEHLLFSHNSLPVGEFAIGTNTTAYMMSRKYGLGSILPILIAEKTGPHFALGDTCYSHEEDMVTFNPDGKAIVARENAVSAKRHDAPMEAYFGCHTDITIPYDELGRLYGVREDGSTVDIITDGRFVLPGVEELNVPFDEV